MDIANEILDAIEIIVDKKIRDNTAQIYRGVCKGVTTTTCTLTVNGKDNTVKYYGGTPTVGAVYQIFVPSGDMSMAFVIVPGTTEGTGESGVSSVNGKTGDVILNADDVGALSSSTIVPSKTSQLDNDSGFIDDSALSGYAKTSEIPTQTSQLTNNSGFITASDVPVQSVDGATGAVVTNAVKTIAQTLTDVQKRQVRINIGAGTSSFDGSYNSLSDKPTIPTQTSQLENNSGFITGADVPTKVSELENDSGYITNTALNGYAKTNDIPTKVSQLNNDAGYVDSTGAKNAAPVQSVDGSTGIVATNAVKTITQTLTDAQKAQARTNIGAGTSSFDGDYESLSNKPTIPIKVSQLENDSNYATESQVNAKYTKPTTGIPKTDLASDVQGSLDKADTALQSAPVTSVNTKTGAVVLTQDDVGDGSTYVRTHNDFTDAAKTQINTNEDNIAILDSDMGMAQADITTLKGNVSTLTTALGSKQDVIAGGASTITDTNLTADRALISNASGKVAVSLVTSTELSYLDGVTSNIQTQLNKKLESAPVTSVNSKTGAVLLGASDVGAVSINDITTTLGTSTTKVPSEKAVSDALSGAGAGDMLKSVYDPNGVVETAGGIPAYVEANGGKIDTIKVNGAAQPIVNKEVDIAVPTSNAQLANGAGYITASDVPVKSVNSKTGNVVLTAIDVGALPDTTIIPVVNNATLNVQRNGVSVGTFTANASTDKTINIVVPIKASDVGALPDTTSIPSKTSELDNDSGFITSAQVPVTSVNTKTGAVTLVKSDIGLSNVDNVKQYSASNPPPYPVTSVNGQTGDVTVGTELPEHLVKYDTLAPIETTTLINADTLQGHAASYFATSAEVSALSAVVDSNADDITANAQNISTNTQNISTLQSNISTLQSSVNGKVSKSGDTMTGALIAQNNTNYSVAQVRNIIISTSDPSGGNSGDIWIKYTP